jgi:hypothetical protein
MMRPLGLLRLTAAGAALGMATLATLAAPAALAGNDIVKCVDAQGRVTLTDQPCDTGSASVRLAAGPAPGASSAYGASSGGDTGSGGPEAASAQLAPQPAAQPTAQRHILPAAELRHSSWRPPVPAAQGALHTAPLARDVATLKAARRALLLLESPRPSLAGLP